MEWLEVKIWLEQVTELDRDALHIYCALVIQFGCAVFFKKGLASPWPWIAALLAALGNEYIDFQGAGTDPEQIERYRQASYHDLWNTMLLPTLLIFFARFWPNLLVGRKPKVIESKSDGQASNPV